jgi:hypothetical protein
VGQIHDRVPQLVVQQELQIIHPVGQERKSVLLDQMRGEFSGVCEGFVHGGSALRVYLQKLDAGPKIATATVDNFRQPGKLHSGLAAMSTRNGSIARNPSEQIPAIQERNQAEHPERAIDEAPVDGNPSDLPANESQRHYGQAGYDANVEIRSALMGMENRMDEKQRDDQVPESQPVGPVGDPRIGLIGAHQAEIHSEDPMRQTFVAEWRGCLAQPEDSNQNLQFGQEGKRSDSTCDKQEDENAQCDPEFRVGRKLHSAALSDGLRIWIAEGETHLCPSRQKLDAAPWIEHRKQTITVRAILRCFYRSNSSGVWPTFKPSPTPTR